MVSMCRIINNNKKREVRHATDCFHMDQKMMCGPRGVRRGEDKMMIGMGSEEEGLLPC